MDLRGPLARAGVARPEVFLTSCPGATEVRLAAEREARVRGWRLAAAPAASNLLVVAGVPATGAASWTAGVWQQIPEPKARADLREAAAVGAVFDDARQRLRLRAGGAGLNRSAHGMLSDDMGMGATRPEAELADDRDGLRLDQVHVPLGPALPDWPAGLILHVALQGDVVQHASVELEPVAPGSVEAFWDGPWLAARRGLMVREGAAARRLCAAHLDSAGRLLAVAGWPDAAARARKARDTALSGRPARDVVAAVRPVARRVVSSRALKWMTAGLGVLGTERIEAAGVTGPAASPGDAFDRLRFWLESAADAASRCDVPIDLDPVALPAPRGACDEARPGSAGLLRVLPGLVEGCELAGARIVVASLDPDLDQFGPARPVGR